MYFHDIFYFPDDARGRWRTTNNCRSQWAFVCMTPMGASVTPATVTPSCMLAVFASFNFHFFRTVEFGNDTMAPSCLVIKGLVIKGHTFSFYVRSAA